MPRNSNYPRDAWRAPPGTEPVNPVSTSACLRVILQEAEEFVVQMPTDFACPLFLQNGHLVQPDPVSLTEYRTRPYKPKL